MKQKSDLKPTDGELEILDVLWNNDACTVRKVHESINETRPSGYTTTLKLMQIMFEKGFVTRDASSKTHVYTAAISKEDTRELFLNKMLRNLYSGSSSALIMHALGNADTSAEELQQINEFIQQLKQRKQA
jgi:predicted transcriptional regulator